MLRRLPLPLLLAAALSGLGPALSGQAALAGDDQQLLRLLETRQCRGCRLQDADLVHANLRDADLTRAQLQRANLSSAQLDGAKLKGANLSFTSLAGASLRGADLRGALLDGTDLRQADLSGALLDSQALVRSHWQRATGVDRSQQSYAELHNAGVTSATEGRYPEAEQFFGEAIRKEPGAAISWVARGIARSELGQIQLAAQDFNYAANLYELAGDTVQAKELKQASQKLLEPDKKGKGGNGLGSQLVGGAMAAFQLLAPIAAKALVGL